MTSITALGLCAALVTVAAGAALAMQNTTDRRAHV